LARKIAIGIVLVAVVVSIFFLAVLFHPLGIPRGPVQPRVNSYEATSDVRAFAINVTNMDNSQLTITGWIHVYYNGTIYATFMGEVDLNPHQTGIIIANSAYFYHNSAITISEILSQPSVYTITAEARVPTPA